VFEKAYLFFPLLAGFLYALSTLGLNAAGRLGLNRIRTTIACKDSSQEFFALGRVGLFTHKPPFALRFPPVTFMF
jgi:hypothetical protein